jgi:hypothetical protein
MTVRDTPTTNPEDERAYARIEQALASLGSEHAPPAGWEDKVLAAVEEEERRRAAVGPRAGLRDWLGRLRLRWMVPALGAAAAAVVAIVMWRGGPKGPPPPSIAAATEPLTLAMNDAEVDPQARTRGTSACSFGKSYVLDIGAAAPHRQLWIYRDGVLDAACGTGGAAPLGATLQCQVLPRVLQATWTPDSRASYTVVAVSSQQAIAAPSGSLDADLASLKKGKIQHLEKSVSCY